MTNPPNLGTEEKNAKSSGNNNQTSSRAAPPPERELMPYQASSQTSHPPTCGTLRDSPVLESRRSPSSKNDNEARRPNNRSNSQGNTFHNTVSPTINPTINPSINPNINSHVSPTINSSFGPVYNNYYNPIPQSGSNMHTTTSPPTNSVPVHRPFDAQRSGGDRDFIFNDRLRHPMSTTSCELRPSLEHNLSAPIPSVDRPNMRHKPHSTPDIPISEAERIHSHNGNSPEPSIIFYNMLGTHHTPRRSEQNFSDPVSERPSNDQSDNVTRSTQQNILQKLELLPQHLIAPVPKKNRRD